MTLDIKRILKKSSWKGEEIGKLLIHTLADGFMANFNEKHKPAVTMEDIDTMRGSIKSPSEGRVYNEYHALHDMLLDLFNWNQATSQQIQHGYFRLWSFLQGALSAETIHQTMTRQIPLIMTEQQYNKHVIQKETELRAAKESYIELICFTASYYIDCLTNSPENVPSKIKAALEKLKKKPVMNQRVISIYNQVMGIGYDELPDGRREDQMSKEEWEALLNEEYDKGLIIVDDSHQRTLETYQPLAPKLFEDKDALDEYMGNIMKFVNLRKYKGIPEEEIKKELFETMNLIPVKWHASTQSPEGLTLWDILDSDGLEELYGIADDDSKIMSEFLTDYEELHYVIREELCTAKPIKEKIDKLKPKQYSKSFVTWGELADWGVLGYPKSVRPDRLDIANGLGHRSINGIAILKQISEWRIDESIDEHGSYIDPYENIKPHLFSLEQIEEQENDIVFARNLFLSSCEECCACLALMDILGDVYDVTETTDILKSKEFGLVEGKIELLNHSSAMLYHKVREQPQKQGLVKKLFPPLDASEVMPTKRAIEAMKERLMNDRNLKYTYAATLRRDIIRMSAESRKNGE